LPWPRRCSCRPPTRANWVWPLAALLHDVGKLRAPSRVTARPTHAADAADLKNLELHPLEGARLILRADPGADLAALVAYEHHMMLNGTGYPASVPDRGTWWGTRLVQVCNEYERVRALSGHAPAIARIEAEAGVLLDPDLVQSFVALLRTHEFDAALTPGVGSARLSQSA
jgi:putative two-component system response regulator